MRRLIALFAMAFFVLALAIPAFACDKAKSASASCATSSKECAQACSKAGVKSASFNCPASKDCPHPCNKEGIKSTDAKATDNMTIQTAVAKSTTKTTVDLTGGAACAEAKAAEVKKADATKAGASCAMDKEACASKHGSKTTAKLANGHPALAINEALECQGTMVAFMSVDKMTCGGCVSHVTKALGTFDGVCAVDVNLDKASAAVVFHPDKVKIDQLVESVTKAGYTTAMKTECTDDMKAYFGENYKEKCLKACANNCKDKEAKKNTES